MRLIDLDLEGAVVEHEGIEYSYAVTGDLILFIGSDGGQEGFAGEFKLSGCFKDGEEVNMMPEVEGMQDLLVEKMADYLLKTDRIFVSG